MIKAQKETGLHILTIEHIEGFEVVEYCGFVHGSAIFGANIMKDFMASLADRVGGRARGYERALGAAMDKALLDMAKDAKKLGAEAIVSVRMTTSDINNRMMMASCYGTAVRIRKRQQKQDFSPSFPG